VESFLAVETRRWPFDAMSWERALPMPEEQPVTVVVLVLVLNCQGRKKYETN
jgi:hypothetical protein